MNFDPDPKKQAKKIIFSQSLKNRVILAYFLTKKTQKNLQKCLGIILDTQLNFKEHLPNNSNELNKTIGLLRKLQTCYLDFFARNLQVVSKTSPRLWR